MEIKNYDYFDIFYLNFFRLRNFFLDLISNFSKNENENVERIIKQIMEIIYIINKKNQTISNFFNSNAQNINIPLSDFDKFNKIKYEETLENNKISFLNYYSLFVNQTCFLLFQKKVNETMIDLIKEDNSNQIEKNLDLKKFYDNKNYEIFDNKNYDEMKKLFIEKLKEFGKLNCYVIKNEFNYLESNQKILIKIIIQMKIENAFQIYLEIWFDYLNIFYLIIEVFGENELFNYNYPFNIYKKNIKNMLVKDIVYKDFVNKNKTNQSKYLLFKKLTTIFQDKLKFIIEHKKKLHLFPNRMNEQMLFQKNVLESILIFLNYVYKYNNLFNKKCLFCNQISKYNKFEKNFYPPYFKFFDFDKDKEYFYHEDCFFFLNNKSL
jgi:hypothetical protein